MPAKSHSNGAGNLLSGYCSKFLHKADCNSDCTACPFNPNQGIMSKKPWFMYNIPPGTGHHIAPKV